MPIIVKDSTWRQTEHTLIVKIPLHGVHPSKVDLLTTPQYIKAAFGRFFFEAFLLHPISVAGSVCTKSDREITFELAKKEPKCWEELEVQLTRSEKQELKKSILEEEYQRVRKEDEDYRNRRGELNRVAVREMIEIENAERKIISQIKQEEKEKALGDLKELEQKHTKKIIELDSSESEEEEEEQIPQTKLNSISSNPIPLPRKTQAIEVNFTKRQFPTPLRESRLEEENEWLRKQAEARRSAGFVSEDLRPEEKNPDFIKAKGDEFMKNSNYLGALSAYSFAIKIAPKFVDLYIARSEAHFLQGNYCKSAEDCSKALELLKPECTGNMKERFYCINRRGRALIELGFLRQGVNELMAALRLKPHDDELQQLIKDTLHQLEHEDEEQTEP